MKEIFDCTLLAIDTYNHGGAIASLRKSMSQCKFEQVIFFTDKQIELDGIEVILIPSLKGKDAYSHFVIKELWRYITTPFVLITQHDSWILNRELFDERLYGIDYAGALWEQTDGLSNGNGGFSWRSKRLLHAAGTDDIVIATSPEDVAICRVYRRHLEAKYNLVWASDQICEQFSFELRQPNQPTFGFHSFFYEPFKPVAVIKRSAAMGDVVMVEPVLDYFYNKGYRVVLDTLPQFEQLFMSHHYPVELKRNFDHKRIPYTEYNLDMSYESKPKQLHLQSYYEFCGIKDGEIKNPILSFPKDRPKIFDKYIILHYDERPQASRNIHGLNWDNIVAYFTEIGYIVIQLGVADFKIKGAIPIKTPDIYFLKWVVSGASYFIGCDSGISHIASGFNIPSIIFFGSVDPNVIHPDLSNKMIITNTDVCEKPFCWGDTIGCSGTPCYIDNQKPPCVSFEDESIITAIKEFVK